MSLLDEYMEEFVILDKTTTDDGYGGYTTVWKEGATIKGALEVASESEVIVADKAGETTTHNLFVNKSITLAFNTVIRRSSDKKTFRVSRSGNERFTPDSSRLNLRKIYLEAIILPMEGTND